jgi:hypothetical protein
MICRRRQWNIVEPATVNAGHEVLFLIPPGCDVNALLYWDAGHGADQDAEDFIAWIAKITRFTGRR